MQNRGFIEEILSKVKCKDAHNDIADELNSHIDDLKERFIEEGYSIENAEKKSIQQMGATETIAREFNKIYNYKFDWILISIVSLLLICGIIIAKMLISSNLILNINKGAMLSILLSAGVSVSLIICNYKSLQKYSDILFVLTVIITILAKFIPVIAEFYLVILTLYLISVSGNIKNPKFDLKIGTMVIVSLLATIFSLGKVSFLLLTISFAALYISFNKKVMNRYVMSILFLLGIIGLMFIIYRYDNSNYIQAYLNPILYKDNEGYIYLQKSKILNNLNFWGNSNQDLEISDLANYNLFTFILAKVGLLGALFIGLLYFSFLLRLVKNIQSVKDFFGKNILTGLTAFFSTQILLNILNGLNIIPYTHAYLPFLTMNVFNIISNMLLVSVFMSVCRRKNLV